MGRALPDPLRWAFAQNPGKASLIALVGAVLGPALLAWGSYRLSLIPWDLDERAPVTVSVGKSGYLYRIEVKGSEYECEGADTKRGNDRQTVVAYDANDPRRCRAARYLGRPSLRDLGFLLAGGFWSSLALVGLALGREAPGMPRGSFYRVARALFWVVLCATVYDAIKIWSEYGTTV